MECKRTPTHFTPGLAHLQEWLVCEEAVVCCCTDRYAVPLAILIQEVNGGGEGHGLGGFKGHGDWQPLLGHTNQVAL
jgi:hypothetical protein